MSRVPPPRGLRPALAASALLLLSGLAAAASPGRAAAATPPGLRGADLDAVGLRALVPAAGRRAAEAVFAEALAAVYVESDGEVLALLPAGGSDLAAAAAEGGAHRTLREFLSEAEGAVARARATLRPFIAKAPAALAAPDGVLPPAPLVAASGASAQAVVLSEGFESDPWSRWQRSDGSGGAYGWTASTCGAHAGTYAADAIRGGTAGASLTCDALYPNSLQTWMVDGQCEALAGAGQAWLSAYISVSSEQGYDYLFLGYERGGGEFTGSLFWGSLPGWWRVLFNLKQWYGIGDLTDRACNQLALVFDADSMIASGWGARVDDIAITTDAPTHLTCAAAATPSGGAAPLEVAFTPTVTDASAGAQSSWSFDDGFGSNAASPTHRYVLPGDYFPTLRVEDGPTRCEAATRVTVAASGVTPTAGTYTGTTSQGKPISITIGQDGTITGYTLGWSCTGVSGDVTVGSLACPVTDSAFDCGAVECQTYTVKAHLEGTFDTPTSAVGVLSYGIRPAPGASCCYQYNATWSASAAGASCAVSCDATVPASAVAGAPVAMQATVNAVNCSGAVTYDWSFGDGSAHATQQNPTHTWAAPGTYPWSVAATADGVTCTQSGSITVTAAQACSVTCSANVPATAAVGAPVQLSSSAVPTSCSGAPVFDWDYGDGSAHGTTQSPSHTWAQVGTYPWTLTVTVDGQTCTRTGSIVVSEPAPCSLTCTGSASSSATVGQAVTFFGSATLSNCSGGATYDWDFGDGSAHSSQQYPSHAYAAAGTYTWTLTVTADGKSCTKSGTVSVCAITCTATVPASGRAGAPVPFAGAATLTGCSSWEHYEWDFGDGSAKAWDQNATHQYAAPGAYVWTMKVSSGAATCTRTGTITIGEQVACADCSATVPATTEAGAATPFQTTLTPPDCAATRSFLWSFGDGTTSSEQSPAHRYCATGTFTWTLTATIGGVACTRTGVITVTTPTALECTLGSYDPAPACPATVRLRSDDWWCTNETTHTWDLGDGQTSTAQWLDHTYGAQGSYTFTMTAHLAGGTCTKTGTITVGPPTSITCSATPPSAWGAPPLAVSFQADVEPASCITSAAYAWTFGDTDASDEQSPTHTYTGEGYFPWAMTVTAEGQVCADSGFVVATSEAPDYTWVAQPSGTTQPLMDVDFTSPDEGWAAGSNGALLHTSDGGRSWAKVGTFSDAYDFRAVDFVDQDTGWLLRHERVGRTSDRGATWKWQVTNAWSERDLFATSSTSAWVTGRTYYIPGLFYPYWDRYDAQPGGTIADGPTINISYAGYQYEWSYGVAFVDADTGWSVGSKGWLYKITNASTSSPTIARHTTGSGPDGVDLFAIQMLDATTGWAVGDAGRIVHTTDAWQTWSAQASGVTTPLRAVHFADALHGWAAGDNGLILATADGGTTWRPENSGTTASLHALRGVTTASPPASVASTGAAGLSAWAVGDGGTILKRIEGTCGTITVSPATLPPAARGVAYSATLGAAGGSAPYAFSLASGTLPPGLALSADGVLSGTPTTAGAYQFTVAASDAVGCSGSASLSLVVPCTITCSAYANQQSTPARTVDFSAYVTEDCQGAIEYLWEFGDGSTSTAEDPTHTYAVAGEYSWEVTATADGSSCTKSGTIEVCEISCSATVPASSRVGAVVTLAATGVATGCAWGTVFYEWDFGDGSSHDWGSTAEHVYAATGTYTWSVVASSGSQSCTRTGTITIDEAVACSSCDGDVPPSTQVGAATAFRTQLAPADCSATLSYRWTFGDGSISVQSSPTHTYCAVGSYTWTLTVTIDGVSCSRTGTINVGAPASVDCSVTVGATGACPYTAAFSGHVSGCDSAAAYAWTLGDGGTAASRNPTHQYTSQGSYDWTMTATLAGATCSDSGTVSVTSPTSITAVGTPSRTWGAPPLDVTFEGGLAYPDCVSSVAYAWSFGDGATSALASPGHTYAADGFYTWSLTASAAGLSSTVKGPVVVTSQAPLYTWAPQLSGTLDPISDATFLSQSEGWTAAQRGLRRTGDSGRSWALSRDTIAYAVRFHSSTAGFYVYSCGVGRTSNGGSSWTTYPYDSCPAWAFTDVFPTSPTFAWATTTNGRLWYFDVPPGSSISYGWRATGAGTLRGLWFTDAENGWAVGGGGTIVKLTGASGTATDEVQPSGTTARLNGVRMLDASTGWIVGDDGTILHTTNGGTSWSPVASGTTINLLAVDFRDGSNGWIVGAGGLVLATTDGGASWHPEVNGWPKELRSVAAPAGTAVYAAGVDGTLLKRLPLVCPEISISPETLPVAGVGTPYSLQLAASGGTPSYTFGLGAGALLDGLDLHSSGTLSGTPSSSGPALFTARAVDNEQCSGDRAYLLETGCALTCSATATPVASPALAAAFTSDATDSCGATVASLWAFGDGASSTDANPQHTYGAPGTYAWSFTATAEGRTCARAGSVVIAPACAVACDAAVPATGLANAAVPFQATAAATGCATAVAYAWTFGDGSSSTQQSPSHAYGAPGTYTWTMTASAGGQTCSRSGSISITAAPSGAAYLIPSVAHNPGAGGTQWRTDVAVVNRGAGTAHLALTYASDTQSLTANADVAAGATVEWVDVLVDRFGLASAASSSGALRVESDTEVYLTSRTYNQTPSGTYGQYYPALTEADALTAADVGTLPQLKKSSGFRTNIGLANVGSASCTVRIRLFKADGVQVGSTKTMTVAARRWLQQYDIFANVGAGSQEVAFARVEVQTAGGTVWAYASVVDSATGDPTTIPVLFDRAAAAASASAALDFVYLVPSVAHNPGYGGTMWRTDVGAVNQAAADASLELTYYGAGTPIVRTYALSAGAACEWRNVLETLFGIASAASSQGTLRIASNVRLCVSTRTYNQTDKGTYGQYYPACTPSHAISAGRVGVLPQLKKSAAFRTNVGILNLGASAVTVAVTVHDAAGRAVGTPKALTVAGGRWLQQSDIFGATGAGSQSIAYATVEVQTAGGAVWAYASVVDAATGDPTTIPVLVQ